MKLERNLFTAFTAAILIATFGACPVFSFTEDDPKEAAKVVSHYMMGLIHDWEGETDLAVQEYEKAAQSDESNHILRLRLGADYARLGKFEDAVRELTLAAKLNPEDVETHYLLALVYSGQQDYEKAAGEYETILRHLSRTDPQNTEIHSYLGQLYLSQKKFELAKEQFEQILALEPKNADIKFMMGSVYLEMNNREKAMEYFKETLEIDPEHDDGLNSLGYMYAEDGVKLDEALAMVKKALNANPENGAYLDSLGWVYYKKGMYPEAFENLLKASALFRDPVIYEHLGDVSYRMKQKDNAEKYWQQSLELLPDQGPVLKKLDALKKGQKPLE